jgi:hypothetical protein
MFVERHGRLDASTDWPSCGTSSSEVEPQCNTGHTFRSLGPVRSSLSIAHTQDRQPFSEGALWAGAAWTGVALKRR